MFPVCRSSEVVAPDKSSMRITFPFYVDYSPIFENIKRQGEVWTHALKEAVKVDPAPEFEKARILKLKPPTQSTGNNVNILA